MAKCATCGSRILLGALEIGEDRFCSGRCAFNVFWPRLDSALMRAMIAEPNPLPDAPAQNPSLDSLFETIEFSDDGRSKDLLVIGFGLSFCALAVAVIYFVLMLVRYPFHAQTVWFVIPIGAYLCGLFAGVGFWIALRSFDRRPSSLTYVAAFIAGMAGYLLIYGLMWWFLELGGIKARDQFGFLDFLQVTLENQRVRFRGAGPGVEVGMWGYPRFVINLLGFAVGVVSVVALASAKRYCIRCKRYCSRVGQQIRSSSDPESAGASLHPVIYALVKGRIQDALDQHAAFGVEGTRGYFTTTIEVDACPNCGLHTAKLTATVQAEKGPQPITDFAFEGACDQTVRIPT